MTFLVQLCNTYHPCYRPTQGWISASLTFVINVYIEPKLTRIFTDMRLPPQLSLFTAGN